MPWGTITPVGQVGRYTVEIDKWPENRMVAMPRPFPNVVAGWVGDAKSPQSLFWMFNEDASQMRLGLPQRNAKDKPHPQIHLITGEKTGLQNDGTVVLSALDAKVVGRKAKLETHPGNHRIGYWVDSRDLVEWNFNLKSGGEYLVELAYSQAGRPGTEVELIIGGTTVGMRLGATGTWYAYTSMKTGRIALKSGSHRAIVRCTKQLTPAVMNLKAVVLHPVRK